MSKRLFCAGLAGLAGLWGCGALLSKTAGVSETQDISRAAKSGIKQWSFFCDPSGLSSDERKRWLSLHEKLRTSRQEVRELPDGYAYRYPSDAATVREVAEFITFERRCCPFLDFDVAVAREGGPLWMSLKGPDGVKEFIRGEFGI